MIKTEPQAVAETQADEVPASGVTPRAVLIGALLSVLLAVLAVCEHALGGGLAADGVGTGALFLLFTLVCGVALLKRFGVVRTGLRPAERMVIFSMLLMVSALPISGVLIYLLPHMAGFVQYATPENEWGSRVIPVFPDGLTIKDPAVAKGFFEGLGPGGEVPYGAWVGPLCAWAVLLGAFCFTMVSLMVIFRKRWMEEERLSFPLTQLPASLVECPAGERPLLSNGIFWFGFGVAAVVGLSVIVSSFLPFVPPIYLGFSISFYRNAISVPFSTNFLALGISYLVSMDILISILLFTLISYVQIYMVTVMGSAILGSPPYVPYAHYTHLHQEGVGALIALVGFGLYESRHHLKNVFRKAFGMAPEVDDGDELISYRAAVIGVMAGVGFVCLWLAMTGISWWVVPIFVGMMLVTFLGLTRILAEAGVVMNTPLSPMQVLLNSAGTRMLGGATMAGFFLAQPWSFPAHWGSNAMASASAALKLTHRTGLRSRPLFWALALALVLGGVAGAVTLLHYAYTLGTYGFANSYYVIKVVNYHLNYYGGAIKDPSAVGQPIRLLWSGIGAAAMGLLILARQRFFWWPIHPIGYPIAAVVPSWWFSAFLAWLFKRNVLKYGGPSLYGRTRPFFLGLIMGQAVLTSAGSLITLLTGQA